MITYKQHLMCEQIQLWVYYQDLIREHIRICALKLCLGKVSILLMVVYLWDRIKTNANTTNVIRKIHVYIFFYGYV